MIEVLITFLLIMGLNVPVYFEMYKHVIRHKSILFQVSITVVYWTAAFITQTLAAFTAVVFLYAFIYRKTQIDEAVRDIEIWHIRAKDAIRVIALSFGARIIIALVNFAYIVVLDKLLKYDIKPQDIVTYYTQAEWWMKGLLAVEIVLVAPIVEEFVFRYFLYDKLLVNKMPRFAAAIISASLFALVHFNMAGVPTFFGLGLFCALMYERKGFFGAVIAHGFCNAFSLFFL